jgi:alpha-beta hydrolase superfamily lysophospholipase
MRFVSEEVSEGVSERLFELDVNGDTVPGAMWAPADAAAGRPLVLMGHGGTQHKKVDTLLARARAYVRHFGYAVAAIDAPGHGDRITAAEQAERSAAIARRIAERRAADPELMREMAARMVKAVPEWQATLDALQKVDVIGADGPVGYWGVSMGTAIGVPFVSAEPRITCAVLGLAGLAHGNEAMASAAAKITIPVEFVLQSDDEIVSRDAGFALFDALGSTEKTLHLNPGGHVGIPTFERDSWERFYSRHLGTAR